MTNKSPAFQFYPGDWLSDINVATMTDQEEGIYIRLISYCWIHGSIPSDIAKIRLLLKNGSTHDLNTLEPVLKCFKLNDDGNYIHGRLEKERQKQTDHREKSSRGGKISADIRQKNRQNKQELKGGSSLVEDGLQPKSNTMSLSLSSSSSSPLKPSEISKILKHKDQNLETIWDKCLEMLKSQVSAESHHLFDNTFPSYLQGGTLCIAVPNQLTRKLMIEQYRESLELFVHQITDKKMLVDFRIEKQ